MGQGAFKKLQVLIGSEQIFSKYLKEPTIYGSLEVLLGHLLHFGQINPSPHHRIVQRQVSIVSPLAEGHAVRVGQQEMGNHRPGGEDAHGMVDVIRIAHGANGDHRTVELLAEHQEGLVEELLQDNQVVVILVLDELLHLGIPEGVFRGHQSNGPPEVQVAEIADEVHAKDVLLGNFNKREY